MDNTMDTKSITQFNIKKWCPTCNAEVDSYTQEHKHTNGYWNQVYVFECGCKIRFSPNFMGFVTETDCPKDPMIIEKNNRFKKEMQRLILYIGKLDLDKADKENLKDKIDSYRRYRH